MILVGGIMMILGVSRASTNYMIDAGVPQQLLHWISGFVTGELAFMVMLLVFLLISGCLQGCAGETIGNFHVVELHESETVAPLFTVTGVELADDAFLITDISLDPSQTAIRPSFLARKSWVEARWLRQPDPSLQTHDSPRSEQRPLAD